MLFPEDGEYSSYLSSSDENEEIIAFDSYNKTKNLMLNAQVEYYRQETFINDPETMLDQVGNENSYNGNFEKLEEKNKDIYIAYKKNTLKDSKNKYNFSNRYFGYVKSTEKENVGIVFSFMFRCPNDNQPCSLNEQDSKKQAMKFVKSVTFLINKKERYPYEY